MTMVKTLEVIGKILSVVTVLMGITFFVMYLIGGQALYDSQWMAAYGTASPYSVIWGELAAIMFIVHGIYTWKVMSRD